MAYKLSYSDYSTASGPPDPAAWVGPPGPMGPPGPQGIPGPLPAGAPFLPLAGGTVSGPLNYTATGGNTSRSAQDRAAEVVNVKDFGAKGDGVIDDTAAINAAIASAVALGKPAEVRFPAGNYVISGTINVTTAAGHIVWLHGVGASFVTILQTADADGIVMLANSMAGLADNGAMRVTGIALKMTGTSTTRTALKLSSTATTGQIGGPIVVDDVLFQSASATALWQRGLVVQSVNAVATWLSRITSVYPNGLGAGLGVAVTVQSVAPNYSSALNLRDVYLVNGDTGLLIGDYLQGVHVHNLNTVNTKNALKVIPTVGGQGLEEIHISDSYLHGQVTFGNASFPTVLFAVFVTGTYFDSIGGVIPANGAHVSIIGTSQIVFSNNIFNGPSTATANVTGLKLTTGAGAFEQLFTGNLFQAYLAGGVAIALDSTTKNIMFVGTSFLNNTTAVTDAGTNNQFSATSNNYVPFIWGSGSVAPTGQAFVDGLINFRGNVNVAGALFATDPNGSVGLGSTAAAGTPYIDFRSSGHSGHDAQIIASGGTGALDGTLAVNAAQLMAPATHANGGIHLGANVGANPQDIIKHVELYEGAGYGFGVTAAQLNYNVPAAAIHHFYVGTTHVAQIGPAGISTGVLGGPAWSSGTGAPAATAQIGSLYSRVDGAVGSTLYVSRGGGTWAAVAGV